MKLPEYLVQGEIARLFPVLATTSKEGRTTSVFLGCLSKVDEFGAALLDTVRVKVGKRSRITCFTEVVFRHDKDAKTDRPDGLIVVTNGSREWRALIEAKVGSSELNQSQIERYRHIAKSHSADCVITISNQFTSHAALHPVDEVRKSKSKVPVFHWSWMSILTEADLLLSNENVADDDQSILLNELRRFLTHESAGVTGFDRMPSEWPEINRLVSAGGPISARSETAQAVVRAWHQETRDLSLILSRQTETLVTEKLSRAASNDLTIREREALENLSKQQCLAADFDIPNAASTLQVVADLTRRTVDVGMGLKVPEDKKSTKARLNWLLRQVKVEDADGLFVRLSWPGRSEDTIHSVTDLREDPTLAERDREGKQVIRFFLFIAKRFGGRFTQQSNFVTDLEALVPKFYRDIGQNLTAWRASAPRIKEEKPTANDVSIDALEEEASGLAAD